MKEGLALDLTPVDYSGATAPELHRLLRFTFESIFSLVARQGGVKAHMVALLSERPSLTTRLTLISHAATAAQRRAAFPSDEPLDERETARVAALGWSAPRVQQVLSGPERRVRETAAGLGLSPTVVADLRDCDHGAWSGRALSEIESRRPEDVVAWLTDPDVAPHGGESLLHLIGRIGRWLDGQRESGHTLAITHPAVIRAAIVHALGVLPLTFWRIDVAPLSVTDLRFNGRVWTVRSCGCALPPGAGPGAEWR